MQPQQRSRVYVIGVNSHALVAFEAISRREANELCKEHWFREELLSLHSDNLPIWNGKEPLMVRAAEPAEIQEYQKAQAGADHKEADGILLAYLIPLDGAV